MAKYVDKDPFEYEQEKQSFLHDLKHFHSSRGSPFKELPKLSGLELDLYLLYLKVTALGGIGKVTDNGQWDGILEYFSLPKNCSHAANALRLTYIRYLEVYEKIHFLGEDEDDRAGPGGRPSTPQGSKDLSGYARSIKPPDRPILESLLSEYDKLLHSLMSGLPNEIDFAINVCTLLSNEGRHILHLAKVPRIIDLLLAHTGVFFEGPGSFRLLYEESWKLNVDRDFVKFWYDTVNDEEVREIIGPESLRPPDKTKYKNPELFCQRKLGLSDIEGQRILQIAIILRNLSFEIPNKPIMAAHRTLYRFLLLCIHNSCSMLRQIGMDTLSNIADEFVLDSIAYRSTQLMFHSVYKGLEDNDRYVVLRSMEILEKLLEVENNLFILQECLEPRVYETMVRTLHIPDVQLLLEALEVLFVLSEKGEPFCTSICRVSNSINILVCLVTLDAHSLGADAFCSIKIIDHAPEVIHQPSMMRTPPPLSSHSATPPPPPPSQQVNVLPGSRSPARHLTAMPPPPPSAATPPAQSSGISNKDIECEKFACQWLACHYEAEQDAIVSRVELYADYLSACNRIAKGNILPSNNFAKCLRMTFPQVGIKKVDANGMTQFHMLGIHKRLHPLQFRWDPGPIPPNGPAMHSLARPASTMMVQLAQRHSPSPNVTPSPPPRTYVYQQNQQGHMVTHITNNFIQAPPPPYHSISGSHMQVPQPVTPPGQQSFHPQSSVPNLQVQLSGNQVVLQSQGQGSSNVFVSQPHKLPPHAAYSNTNAALPQNQNMLPTSHTQSSGQPIENNKAPSATITQPCRETPPPVELPVQISALCQTTVPVPEGTPTSVSSQGSLDFPQPPITPPINPMLDALSPSGTPTNIPPTSSDPPSKNPPPAVSPTESLSEASVTETDTPQNTTEVDLMDGEVRIQKVPNSLVKKGEEGAETASKCSDTVDYEVNSVSSAADSVIQSASHTDSSDLTKEVIANKQMNDPKDVTAVQSTTTQMINQVPVSTVSVSNTTVHQGFPTAAGDALKVVPAYTGPKPVQISQGMTVVHNNQLVQQVMPGKMTSIQNVLVPQQGIVLNVQPMMQGQVQLMPQNIGFSQPQTIQIQPGQTVNFQPRQHVNIQPKQPISIQPKHQGNHVSIQPKPVTQNLTMSNGQNVSIKPVVTSSFQIPQGKPINIQSAQTIVHQGQPMMALQRPMVQSQQIVLGQYTVVQPQQSTQHIMQPQQCQINQGQTVVTSMPNQNNLAFSQGGQIIGQAPTGTVQFQNQAPASTSQNPPFLNFGRVSQCTQNTNALTTDSPLIKQLLKRGSPLSPPKQPTTQQQNTTVQIVQHQGQFVAVNQWPMSTQNPSQAAFQRQGLINIAPRPPHSGQQPYASHLVVSVPPQPSAGKVQYGPDGVIYPCNYLSSPTSSSSSSSKSKKKKSKKSKSKSKKKHKDRRTPSPGCSSERKEGEKDNDDEDSRKTQSPSEMPSGPANNGPNSVVDPSGKPKVLEAQNLPVTVPAANPNNLAVSLIEDSGLKRTYGLICNGTPAVVTTKKKPPKSPKREKQKTKAVNGIGEEHLLPIEVKIERIENPNHILNQKQKSKGKDSEVDKSEVDSNSAIDKESVASGEIDSKDSVVPDILEEAMKEISPGRNKNPLFLESSDENSQDSLVCGSEISLGKRTEDIFQDDFVVDEKLAKTDAADVKEAVNHIMNGQIWEKKITAGLERKLQKEIEKTLKRTLENEMKGNSVEKSDIDEVVNRTNCQSQNGVNTIHTNGPSKCSDALDVLRVNCDTKQDLVNGPDLSMSNSIVNDSSQQNAGKNVGPINGHVLPSPNTSLSSSPLSSPPSVDPNFGPPSLSQGQAHFPPSPASTCSDTRTATPEPRGIKRMHEEGVRVDMPNQFFMGTMSPPPVAAETKKSKSSKKRRSSSTSSTSSKKHSKSDKGKSDKNKIRPPPVNPLEHFYLCEWTGCNKSFPSAKTLHSHACSQHVISSAYRGVCEWEACDNIKRQRWSTVTHIQDKHCSEDALLAAAERRAQQAIQGPPPVRDPNCVPQPVVYTAHTAYHAIRRSLVAPALKDLLGENEGPVTKSIRITASLILKNLTEYSEDGRRLIKLHENVLSMIALSTVESATTIAKCLFILREDER